MFLVKGGTVDVLVAANAAAGPIEREPITYERLPVGRAILARTIHRRLPRLFRRYLALGAALMVVYALSVGAYLAFVVYGYRAAGDRVFIIGWTVIAAFAAVALVLWITFVNLLYLLMQVAMAMEDWRSAPRAVRSRGSSARSSASWSASSWSCSGWWSRRRSRRRWRGRASG